MKKVLTFLGSIFYYCAFAQLSISGTVDEGKNKPLSFANILVYQLNDSSLIKGEISDEAGKFELNQIDSGSYFLIISMLGYEDYVIPGFNLYQDQLLDPITLSESTQNLETVTVTAKKPFLEQRAGKLVVNVENSIGGNNGSVQDLLKRVPGMLVVNGQLKMVGKPNVIIYIDGKPTQYMDVASLLKEMPADNIQKIEVISQADASYDAAGTGGIINIVMKKNVLLGTNGTARLGLAKGAFWGYNASLSLNHRKNKVNTFASGSFSHNTDYEGLEIGRVVQDKYFHQENFQPDLPFTYSLRAGLDYTITDQHTIGLSARGTTSSNDRVDESSSNIYLGADRFGELIQTFKTDNTIDRDWTYGSVDAYYKFEIDTIGQKLQFSGNISNYDRLTKNLNESESLGGDFIGLENTRNNQPSNVTIRALKIDYTKPINNTLQMQFGAKWAVANIDSDVTADSEIGNQWVPNPNLSNHFIFDEEIIAGYLNGNYTTKKIEIAVGLRYEHTKSVGNSLTLDSINNRKYSQLFPSASISLPVNDHFGISGAYSYRINRPRYNSLNPFVYYLNPITFQKGNPFLTPELTHSFKLSVTYDKQPFLNLEYNRTNDVIELVTEQDDVSGIAFGQDINLDRYDQIGGSLFFPLDFVHKSVSGYGGIMMYHNWYGSDYLGGYFDESQFTLNGFIQANIKLKKNLTMEVVGWYQGKSVEGIIRAEPLYGISAGFEQNLFDHKGTLALNFDDFLFRYFIGRIDYQNQQMDIVSKWQTQGIRLSFSYRFGNQFIKKNERVRSSSEEENRRVQ